MLIKTQYGSIEYNDIKEFDLSTETLAFIKKQQEASEIFFSDEIDLTEVDDDFNDQIKELVEVVIIENKFSNPAKAFAIAEYTEAEFDDIEESTYNPDEFEVNGDTYLVFTDEEADEEAKTRAKDLLDDIGIDGLSDNAKQHIFDNFINTDYFDTIMKEYIENYAYDIKNEDSSDSDLYVNRLHEEMVDRGIMNEPEWPEEDDFENEDDESEEPQPEDFETEEEYTEAHEYWEEREIEKSQNNSYEDAKTDYTDTLESEIENKIEDFVELLCDDYENGLEYYKDNFGSDEVEQIIKDNDLIDIDAVAEYIIDADGRGYTISAEYDEDSITINYRGEKHEFYIYKM